MNRTFIAGLLIAGLLLGIAPLCNASDLRSLKRKYCGSAVDALCKKVGRGEASDSELQDMVKAFQQMNAATPPKGDAASWKTKTKALVSATQSIQAKDPRGIQEYKLAVNCDACHKVHKP